MGVQESADPVHHEFLHVVIAICLNAERSIPVYYRLPLRWDNYESEDDWFLRLVGQNITYVRLFTNSDGGCALHAAFGECGSHELKCQNARERELRMVYFGCTNVVEESPSTDLCTQLSGRSLLDQLQRPWTLALNVAPKRHVCGTICQCCMIVQ